MTDLDWIEKAAATPHDYASKRGVRGLTAADLAAPGDHDPGVAREKLAANVSPCSGDPIQITGLQILAIGPWFESKEYRRATVAATGRERTSFEHMMLDADWPETVKRCGRDETARALDCIAADLERRLSSTEEQMRGLERRANNVERSQVGKSYRTVDDEQIANELETCRRRLRLFKLRLNHLRAFRAEVKI